MQINKPMQSDKQKNDAAVPASKAVQRPNEAAAFCVHGHVRIFDPETQETIVEVRS